MVEDRKKRWRERQRASGMVQVRVWVPEHQVEQIKAVAESFRPAPIDGLPDEEIPKATAKEPPPTPKMLEFAAEIEERHGIQAPARIKRSKLLLWLWIRRNRNKPSLLDGIQEEGRRRRIARLEQRIAKLQAQLRDLTDEPLQGASQPQQKPAECYGIMFRFPVKPPSKLRDQVRKMGCLYHADRDRWTVKVRRADREFLLTDLHNYGAEILVDEPIPCPS
jgi:hypothetical protein